MRSGLIVLLFLGISTSFFIQVQEVSRNKKHLAAVSDSADVISLVHKADKLYSKGEAKQSMKLLYDAKALADSLNNIYLQGAVAIQFAANYLNEDLPDSARQVLERMSTHHLKQLQQVKILNLLATSYRYKGNYPKAISIYKKAKALVDSVKNSHKYEAINLNLALVYQQIGDMGTAFRAYKSGLKMARNSRDSTFMATLLNNLGDAYNKQSDFQQAQYYLEQSIQICKKANNKIGLLRATNNLANTREDQKQYTAALSLYRQAIALEHQLRPGVFPFREKYNLGNLYMDMGKLAQAEKVYRQSLLYCQNNGVPQGAFYNDLGLGDVAEKRNDLHQATSFYQEALNAAQKLDSAPFQKQADKKLYGALKKQHNYQRALVYYEKYNSLSDSLQQVDSKNRLDQTKAMLNLNMQEQKNKLLQDKQHQQAKRIQIRNWLIGGGLVVIIVIIAFLILLYRSNTERQYVNGELEAQRNQLEELNQIKDKILAIIAHDLRSPLSSMQGMFYLLREKELSKKQVEHMAAQLEVSLNQNINMIDNLLAWAQEQMSGLAVNIETLDPAPIIKELLEQQEFQATHKGIQLVNEVEPGLKVKADVNLFKLIVRNLIANSIKFSGKDDVVTIRAKNDDQRVIFNVEDTGIGIPDEHQEELFSDDESQESRRGTHNEKGSGLGLQLCKEFVEKQNGEIYVESTVGEGAVFSFSLPKAS